MKAKPGPIVAVSVGAVAFLFMVALVARRKLAAAEESGEDVELTAADFALPELFGEAES